MKQPKTIQQTLRQVIVILVLAAFLAVFAWMMFVPKQPNTLSLSADTRIDLTPERIEQVKAIGQWEFLAVADEELIDTIRRGFFSDDHLVRIYYGTLRIGIDLSQAKGQWLYTRGDTLVAILPPVGLLDREFIDEARTKSFYEKGDWTAADREQMYQRARQKMLRRALTSENLKIAEQNAETQLAQLFRSMGFPTVVIRFN